MHPVIRVAGLAALAVGLAPAAAVPLLLATGLLAALAVRDEAPRAVFLEPAKRLKWLLVSITALYAWLLPGDPLLNAFPAWSPTVQGIAEGLRRCWMLLLMAGAARWLMATTPREQVMGALYWFLRPLERFGIHSARFCLRLVLTLEYALTFRAHAGTAAGTGRGGGFTERAAELARSRLRAAEAAADAARPGPVVIPRCGAPPWWQWAGPAALLIALLVLSMGI